MRNSIEQLTDHASHICEQRQEKIIAAARDRMQNEIDAEIDRLRQLARLNPNVRAEEITALERNRDDYAGCLDRAQLKLDAIRIVVAT